MNGPIGMSILQALPTIGIENKWNNTNTELRGKFKTAKSNDKTHQTNGQQLSYSWLGTGILKRRKWWIEPGFIALNLSLIWQSH